LRLGVHLGGDRFPETSGVHNHDGWVVLAEQLLDQHFFILGGTGAGKSETIKRLLLEVMSATDRDVFFVDAKGDEDLAAQVRSLAYRTGRGLAPIFRLGFSEHGAIYNGFCGGKEDIYNRLVTLVGARQAEGNAQYYADTNRDLLQLICYAPGGPPRSFEEVRKRLSRWWLLGAYKDNSAEKADIEDMDKRDIEGLKRRIRPLARSLAPAVGPEGFTLEATRCAIFSLRSQSVGDTAERLLGFLIEDLKDFFGKRQERPAVLVIDEFGQFDNESIVALLSMGRSAKLGVILATQDVATLKDERIQRLILANTRTKILMSSDNPEEVGQQAGTKYQVESSFQHEDGGLTGLGSSRIQHSFKVDMNQVAQLLPGEGFLIRHRYAVRFKTRMIGQVEPVEPQEQQMRQVQQSSRKGRAGEVKVQREGGVLKPADDDQPLGSSEQVDGPPFVLPT
jgi:hypothetical protein